MSICKKKRFWPANSHLDLCQSDYLSSVVAIGSHYVHILKSFGDGVQLSNRVCAVVSLHRVLVMNCSLCRDLAVFNMFRTVFFILGVLYCFNCAPLSFNQNLALTGVCFCNLSPLCSLVVGSLPYCNMLNNNCSKIICGVLYTE